MLFLQYIELTYVGDSGMVNREWNAYPLDVMAEPEGILLERNI